MKKLLITIACLLLIGCGTVKCPQVAKDIKQNTSYKYCDFTGADLKEADFSNDDLSYAIFNQADLRQAKFINANLTNSNFKYANAQGANFTGAWAGIRVGNYVQDSVGFLTYKANFIGATWVTGSMCNYKSIGECFIDGGK